MLVIDDAATARPLAEALVSGGLRVLEVTLRTPAALDAIREMKQVPGAIVGAGTVVSVEQFGQVMDAGAEFIVSPGLTETLGRPIVDSGVPFLPGVANAGDIMRGYDLGLRHFKFFPAEANGGLKALKSLAAPFYEAQFCPTGGITAASAPRLSRPSARCCCVGGSWITPAGASMDRGRTIGARGGRARGDRGAAAEMRGDRVAGDGEYVAALATDGVLRHHDPRRSGRRSRSTGSSTAILPLYHDVARCASAGPRAHPRRDRAVPDGRATRPRPHAGGEDARRPQCDRRCELSVETADHAAGQRPRISDCSPMPPLRGNGCWSIKTG